jgi:UDP-N-acetyl-D-glucosamine dehydrogenase
VIKLLMERGADVSYHDPYVPEVRLNGDSLHSVPVEAAGYDCAIIATDHGSIDYAKIVEGFPLVVDTRNATKGVPGGNVVKL